MLLFFLVGGGGRERGGVEPSFPGDHMKAVCIQGQEQTFFFCKIQPYAAIHADGSWKCVNTNSVVPGMSHNRKSRPFPAKHVQCR